MTDKQSETSLLSKLPTGLYIDGTWRDAADGATFAVEDPSTGETIAEVADAGVVDGAAALDAAVAKQAEWGATAPRVRAELLRGLFEAVIARAEDFALLMTLEMGKPVAEAKGEVAYGAEFLRWFSEEAPRIAGRYSVAPDGVTRLMVHKRPVGPCLLITPWNFPLAMATRKIAPAIAAGCTMVLKPAALTPLTTMLLTQVAEEVGLPAGVLNIVQTTKPGDVTGPMIKDDRLRKLSFTGSTPVGRRLLADASEQVLKTSMELGGNAPFLVFDDADVDAAVDGAMKAKMRNMGEACTSANRFIVHESVAAEFSEKLVSRMSALTVARGTEDGADVGPLIDEKSRDKVRELVDDAVERGAEVLCGATTPEGAGWFYPPTVLGGVDPQARILHEEVFGPVAPITTFSDEKEAYRLANDTEYGLVAYAYTRSLTRSLRIGEQVDSGMLGINTGLISNPAAPFGGVKHSGLGREGGLEGIEEYLETRYVAMADPYADQA